MYLGRKDSVKASVALANEMIPAPNSTLDVLFSKFAAQGLDLVDLVALSGTDNYQMHPTHFQLVCKIKTVIYISSNSRSNTAIVNEI